jgi:hypothetical protein
VTAPINIIAATIAAHDTSQTINAREFFITGFCFSDM